MKELSEQREDWIPIYGGRAYEILKVRVQLENGEETDWWKIYDVQSGRPGISGHREFVAHAPSKEAAYNQIERLKNGPHTHLGCNLVRERAMVSICFTDERLYIRKDGEDIMTFEPEENLGDIYYNIMNLLKALNIEFQTESEF